MDVRADVRTDGRMDGRTEEMENYIECLNVDYKSQRNETFYDLQLNNWEINSFPYDVKERFDLIACTRCPYFSKYPTEMLSEFRRLLKPGGVILIDWAVGDHWRFDEFAVGWKHHG